MGRAGWLRGLLLVACLAGGDAYVVPTSQHVLQLAARRAASPPPRAPSTTATMSGDDLFDEQMKVRRVRVSRSDGRCAPPQCVCVGWGGGGRGGGREEREGLASQRSAHIPQPGGSPQVRHAPVAHAVRSLSPYSGRGCSCHTRKTPTVCPSHAGIEAWRCCHGLHSCQSSSDSDGCWHR